MNRFHIEIDEELLRHVLLKYSLPSAQAAVEFALREIAGEYMTTAEAIAMAGTGWEGNL